MKKTIILALVVLLGLSWYTAVSETVSIPLKKEAHLKKAADLEAKEIYVDAITEYEAALQYEPDSVEISMKLANVCLAGGDSQRFIAICEQTAEANQDETEAMDLLMNYYLENACENKAVKYLDQFVKDYPENQNAKDWFLKLKGSYTELYCRYEEMSGIFHQSMVVKKEDAYGMVDATGSEILPVSYKELHPFSEDGFALAVKADGSYVYIDKEEQIRKAPDKGYQDLGMLSEGCVTASKNGKYGYLDENMEPACEFVWDDLTGIKNRIGAGKKGGKWALISKNGKEKTEFLYDDVIMDENGFCSEQKCIFVKENGSYHLVNLKGKAIGEETFEDAKAFYEEGYAAVCKKGKWGFADTKGTLVIDCAYEDAGSFRNGFAAVKKDGLWGYVDTEGNLVIAPTFQEATPVSKDGTVAVKMEAPESGEEEWRLIQFNLFL